MAKLLRNRERIREAKRLQEEESLRKYEENRPDKLVIEAEKKRKRAYQRAHMTV